MLSTILRACLVLSFSHHDTPWVRLNYHSYFTGNWIMEGLSNLSKVTQKRIGTHEVLHRPHSLSYYAALPYMIVITEVWTGNPPPQHLHGKKQ